MVTVSRDLLLHRPLQGDEPFKGNRECRGPLIRVVIPLRLRAVPTLLQPNDFGRMLEPRQVDVYDEVGRHRRRRDADRNHTSNDCENSPQAPILHV